MRNSGATVLLSSSESPIGFARTACKLARHIRSVWAQLVKKEFNQIVAGEPLVVSVAGTVGMRRTPTTSPCSFRWTLAPVFSNAAMGSPFGWRLARASF